MGRNQTSGRAGANKGRKKEMIVKHQLEEQGWFIQRAGGSLGVFDLIGMHPDVNIALLIQVKANRAPDKQEREKILSFLAPDYCQKIVWVVKDGIPKEPEIYHYNSSPLQIPNGIVQVPYEWYLKTMGT